MKCVQVSVGPDLAGGWSAHFEDRNAGPYHSRDFALRVAIIEALRLRGAGRAARVSVYDEGGSVCAEQCLCKEFR
jgi:hypothetical protein